MATSATRWKSAVWALGFPVGLDREQSYEALIQPTHVSIMCVHQLCVLLSNTDKIGWFTQLQWNFQHNLGLLYTNKFF